MNAKMIFGALVLSVALCAQGYCGGCGVEACAAPACGPACEQPCNACCGPRCDLFAGLKDLFACKRCGSCEPVCCEPAKTCAPEPACAPCRPLLARKICAPACEKACAPACEKACAPACPKPCAPACEKACAPACDSCCRPCFPILAGVKTRVHGVLDLLFGCRCGCGCETGCGVETACGCGGTAAPAAPAKAPAEEAAPLPPPKSDPSASLMRSQNLFRAS